jgi:CSLREA domain-containing protein
MPQMNPVQTVKLSLRRGPRVAVLVVVLCSLLAGGAAGGAQKESARSVMREQTVTPPPAIPIQEAPAATVVIGGNPAPIVINDNTQAALYPSIATISGVSPATVTRVRVQLTGLTHTFPDDVDVILEGPQGQRAMLMSDAGGGDDVSGINLLFDPTSANILPDTSPPALAGGTFRPANYGNTSTILTDTFPAPFPAPNTLTDAPADLSVFNLTDPNGQWKLYVVDDAGADTGTISGGWTLFLTVPTIFTVNSAADPGNGVCDVAECTLREAINAAIANTGSGDLVNFSSLFNTPQTINLATALPDLNEFITIQGPGAHLLTVRRADTAPDFRIFNIPGGITSGVFLSGLTISNGRASGDAGGGIFSQSNLTLTDVAVTGNQASNGGGGGVELESADGVFTGCTFSNNTSTFGGAGIRYIGDGGHTLRVTGSTVSGNNNGNNIGAGILNLSNSGNSRLEVVNSTITNNVSGNGGGIFTFTQVNPSSIATTTLRNTIIANNTPTNLATGTSGGGAATFQTLGFNLSDNFNNQITLLGTDIQNATPRLGPLALNGGTTPTHALLGGSPALNAGDASGSATDQRGVARPATGADIGAVEMRALTVSKTADTNDGACNADCSLREAIAAANANGAGLDDIIFDNTVFNTARTITLASGELAITSNLTINGPGANLLTVSGNNASRVFSISSSSNAIVSISGMTISDGNVVPINGFGGGIFNGTTNTLTVTNSTISGNSALNGGGIRNSTGTLTVTNSTISGNTATRLDTTGGGIDNIGTLTLTNSTISGNSAPNGIFNMGGGIFTSGTTATITNSTITNNSAAGASSASGVLRNNGTVNIRNSIIAGNVGNATQPDVVAINATGFTSNGFNLIGNRGTVTFGATGDQAGGNGNPILNPLLGVLQNNGGTTATHALLAGSPALDTGNSSGATSDQRGLTRPFDLPITNTSDGADIGALEAQTVPTDAAPTASPTAANVTSAGGSSYIFTVTYTDDAAINVSTIGMGDFTVNGPNGFTATPAFVNVNNQTNGTPRTAVYQLIPPGGNWDIGDNGTYTITMRANEVGDLTGNFVAAGAIGSFTVNIAGPTPTPTPTATPTPTPCVPVTTSYTGPAVAIPDNNPTGVNATLNVSGFTGNIADLNFRFGGTASSADPLSATVGVNHSFISDLRFTLTSPAGTSVVFYNRLNNTNCNSNNLFNLTLDDEAGGNMTCPGDDNGGPLTGTFRPDALLSAFDGQNPNGTWTLNAADVVNIDVGSLRAFSLVITPQACGAGNPSVMQFSAASFTANEPAALATVTVNRAGGTTDVASVDYKTNDSFNFADCAALSTTADQRCDYAAQAGTLTFAAGETSKTFTIPLTDDFYIENNETIGLALSNPTGGTIGANSTATLTVTNEEDVTQVASANNRFFAFLSGAQEVPAVTTTATGFGRVDLNQAETQITANMTFSGLSSAQTAAHIHGAAPVGVNAPVLFNLGTGQITNLNFAVTPAQVAQLKAGMFYLNIHTSNFPGGEIRGQVLPNPAESARFFVRQQYADFLSREPDTGGFDFWTTQIANFCAANPDLLGCTRQRRIAVSNAFFFELEFQQTGAYVYRLYRAAYGNSQPFPNPNADGGTPILAAHVPAYERFIADRARLDATQLAASQLALATNFVQRPEFTARYPLSQTGPQFVDALLGTIQSASGANLMSQRDALIAQFNSGGRGAVLFRLAEDNAQGNPINNRAFIDAEYNRSFVITQYYGYLRRDGDLPGLNFWFDIVNRFPLPTSQNAMVCAFITSTEYQQRFNSYFTRSNQECQ